MRTGTDEQDVAPRRAPEAIEVSIDCAEEIAGLAAKLDLPQRTIRRVIVLFAADVLNRKVKGQVARIFKAHLDGLLPSSNQGQGIVFSESLQEAVADASVGRS